MAYKKNLKGDRMPPKEDKAQVTITNFAQPSHESAKSCDISLDGAFEIAAGDVPTYAPTSSSSAANETTLIAPTAPTGAKTQTASIRLVQNQKQRLSGRTELFELDTTEQLVRIKPKPKPAADKSRGEIETALMKNMLADATIGGPQIMGQAMGRNLDNVMNDIMGGLIGKDTPTYTMTVERLEKLEKYLEKNDKNIPKDKRFKYLNMKELLEKKLEAYDKYEKNPLMLNQKIARLNDKYTEKDVEYPAEIEIDEGAYQSAVRETFKTNILKR